ncbi:hypothetical protein G6F24_015509 [Rhizopus arrhizus]|nr:hypothetical protein G6F24_015509 [Rhizopus arrhizus]
MPKQQAVFAPGGADADAAGARVTLHVGQQFLDDAVDGDFGVAVQASAFGVGRAQITALQARAGLQILQQRFQRGPQAQVVQDDGAQGAEDAAGGAQRGRGDFQHAVDVGLQRGRGAQLPAQPVQVQLQGGE